MRFGILFVAFVLLAIAPAASQVVIDREDVESRTGIPIAFYSWDDNDNFSGSAMPDTSGLAAILAGGEADFTTIASGLQISGETVLTGLPQDVLGADSFKVATHVEVTRGGFGDLNSTHYRFLTLSDEGLVYLGTSLTFDTDGDEVDDSVTFRYEPDGWQVLAFPARVGSQWSNMFTQQAWVTVPGAGLIRSTSTTEVREYEVTGTAMLTTPDGSAEAIVVHEFEDITFPGGFGGVSLERFSFLAESGLAVTVAWEVAPESRERLRLHDVTYFARTGSSAVDVVAGDVTASGITLGESYPNPVVGTGMIRFTLGYSAVVRLTLFNGVGEEVGILAEGVMEAGEHMAEFSTDNLPNGLYTVTLQTDETVITQNIVVRK